MLGYYPTRIFFFIKAIVQEMLNLNDCTGTLIIINPSSSTAFPLHTLVTGNVRKVHLPHKTSQMVSLRLIKCIF